MDVHGDQFLGLFGSYRRNGVEEIDKFLGVVSLGVEEVQAILDFFDIYGVFVGGVFEDELFEIEKGSLVWHFLSYLDDSSPCIGSE